MEGDFSIGAIPQNLPRPLFRKEGNYFFGGNILVKIKRVKVEELRRKSTKGRK